MPFLTVTICFVISALICKNSFCQTPSGTDLALAICSWAVLNCWTRLYLGVHYVGDILTGVLWGSFAGWMVYQLCVYLDRRLKIEGAALFTAQRAKLLTEGILITFVALLIYATCRAIL